jgi:hypothetical protein
MPRASELLLQDRTGNGADDLVNHLSILEEDHHRIERTLNRVAVLMFASTSSLATFALPEYSVAS